MTVKEHIIDTLNRVKQMVLSTSNDDKATPPAGLGRSTPTRPGISTPPVGFRRSSTTRPVPATRPAELC